MRSRNWRNGSAAACAIISLLAAAAAPAQTPAIVVVEAADAPLWQEWAKTAGWRGISAAARRPPTPAPGAGPCAAPPKRPEGAGAAPPRLYLAGRGTAAAAVFYPLSRTPDVWAAGIAIEGSPQPAVDTDRLFAANFTN